MSRLRSASVTTNTERFIRRADLTSILAFVDRLSTREVLLTFKGVSAEDTTAQRQEWIRRVLPSVQDLVAECEAWTDPDPPCESHVLLRFDATVNDDKRG